MFSYLKKKRSKSLESFRGGATNTIERERNNEFIHDSGSNYRDKQNDQFLIDFSDLTKDEKYTERENYGKRENDIQYGRDRRDIEKEKYGGFREEIRDVEKEKYGGLREDRGQNEVQYEGRLHRDVRSEMMDLKNELRNDLKNDILRELRQKDHIDDIPTFFGGEAELGIPLPILSSTSDSTNTKKVKEFLSVNMNLKFKNTSNSKSAIYGFLNDVVNCVNSVIPRFTRTEYTLIVMNIFESDLRHKITALIDGGYHDIQPQQLHHIILTAANAITNLPQRKSAFYSFIPQGNITLIELIQEVKLLGKIANIAPNDVYEKIVRLLPSDAASEIRQFYLLRKMFSKDHTVPSPQQILTLLTEQSAGINKQLSRMYSNDRRQTDRKVYNVESGERQKKQTDKQDQRSSSKKATCSHCLKLGHSKNECWLHKDITCSKCKLPHPTSICRKYKGGASENPCKICMEHGVKLFHDTESCRQSYQKN